MKYNRLGSTGITVSLVAFGTLTLSPLQRDIPLRDAAKTLHYAIERGICFFDTAQLYHTYPLIREALGVKKDLVISSKAYVYDQKGAADAVYECLREIGRDYVDVFMLHEQESEHTLRGHREALEELQRLKAQGFIRAVGISTHSTACASACLKHAEIEVVHPIFNKKGIGLLDGTVGEMEKAVEELSMSGRGVFAMKALGGGHLLQEREDCLQYAKTRPGVDSIAIGMLNEQEVAFNVNFFEKGVSDQDRQDTPILDKKVLVQPWCIGCGNCQNFCPQKAIQIREDRATIDKTKCILCGYCGAACRDFALKIG